MEIGNGKLKLFLFADYMILFIGNIEVSIKRELQLTKEFNEVAGCKHYHAKLVDILTYQ
jgi:hypothetical protein